MEGVAIVEGWNSTCSLVILVRVKISFALFVELSRRAKTICRLLLTRPCHLRSHWVPCGLSLPILETADLRMLMNLSVIVDIVIRSDLPDDLHRRCLVMIDGR